LFENFEIGGVFSFMENFLRDESGEFVAELLRWRVKIEGKYCEWSGKFGEGCNESTGREVLILKLASLD
jgi:hypothetical protein